MCCWFPPTSFAKRYTLSGMTDERRVREGQCVRNTPHTFSHFLTLSLCISAVLSAEARCIIIQPNPLHRFSRWLESWPQVWLNTDERRPGNMHKHTYIYNILILTHTNAAYTYSHTHTHILTYKHTHPDTEREREKLLKGCTWESRCVSLIPETHCSLSSPTQDSDASIKNQDQSIWGGCAEVLPCLFML